jgi:hypothetical protein
VGRGTVPGGGAADMQVWPVSGAWERESRVGRPEKETELPSLDEQYGFGFI